MDTTGSHLRNKHHYLNNPGRHVTRWGYALMLVSAEHFMQGVAGRRSSASKQQA